MKKIAFTSLLLSLATGSLHAQEVSFELPEYTDAQRWSRAGTLVFAVLVGDIAGNKRQGMTAEQSGKAAAAIFGPPNGWNNSDTPIRLLRGMYFNWMSHPQQRCELVQAGPIQARARCNRPYIAYFGDAGRRYGVTIAEFEESMRAFASTIAERHGMDWHQGLVDGDLLITVSKH